MSKMMQMQMQSILEEKDLMAALCNFTAGLKELLEDVNWLGFYIRRENELVLGPFQGKVACTHIPIGKGVCGTAASTQKVIRVDDVDKFEGHIVCDGNSKSEIVLPIIIEDKLWGVLDIDSPIYNRFSLADENDFKAIIDILQNRITKQKDYHI